MLLNNMYFKKSIEFFPACFTFSLMYYIELHLQNQLRLPVILQNQVVIFSNKFSCKISFTYKTVVLILTSLSDSYYQTKI